jgi:succinate-semialdehyde dehydrogenase/glutarate-semialdehyde dehydrogenase
VAALITPWNFPFAMIAKKLAAAIAADCAVIVKPSGKTPLSMIALFELLREAGFPAGRANLVIGRSAPIGQVLCQHPGVRVLSFTGSTAVGRTLISATADQVKRLSLELGGNAPFLVFEDADPAYAAEQLVQNKLRASGQTCVCTNRVFVHRAVAEPFVRALVERVGPLRVGDGMEPGVDLGPLIDRAGYEKVRAHVEDALANGAVRVAGHDFDPEGRDFGFFFPPTVLRGVTMGMACTREETFGPIFPIVEFETEAEALTWSNQTDYGLAAYVFTEDEARAERVVEQLRFGHVGLNTGTGPAPEAPFGGMKQSGFGREGGAEGLLEFVELQTVPRRST